MTLLLKALKQSKWPGPTVRKALDSQPRKQRLASQQPRSSPPDELDALHAEIANFQDDLANAAILDPADYISGATAVIEPFEPFQSTANEYLEAGLLPVSTTEIADELDDIADTEIDIENDADWLPANGGTVADTESSALEASADLTPSPPAKDAHAAARREATANNEAVELIIADEPETVQSVEFPDALLRLEQLHRLIAKDRDVLPKPRAAKTDGTAPLSASGSAAPPKLSLRVEYRELRDHLLARFPLQKPCSLLVVDAGRITCDASWLVPLAASIVQHVAETGGRTPRILIVEAGGPESGIVRGLGLESKVGVVEAMVNADILGEATIPTEHPQVFLLGRGNTVGSRPRGQLLAQLWPKLQPKYDLVLISAGSLAPDGTGVKNSISATDFIPLADGVILSVELDGTPREVAEEVRRRLVAKGGKIIGCVVHGGDAA